MEKKRVLFIAQEMSPYVAQTPLSQLARTLAQELQSHRLEVRAFMPKYGSINERRNQLHEVIRLSGLNLSIDDNDHPLIIKVATLLPTRMQVYFIDSEDYFQPTPDKQLETVTNPEDNDERIMFFAHGVIETVKKLRWRPAVVQCDGWATAMVPVYLKDKYGDDPTFSDSRVVYTLHSDRFDGQLDPRMTEKLAMAGFQPQSLSALEGNAADWESLNRLAIDHADAVVKADADVPQELVDYALATGKPVLNLDATPDSAQIAQFYQQITSEE